MSRAGDSSGAGRGRASSVPRVGVVVRIRPPPQGLSPGSARGHGPQTSQPRPLPMEFDQVYGSGGSQGSVFQELFLPLVTGFLEGSSGAALIYGGSRTGKTFTLEGEGGPGSSYEGMLPRVVSAVLQRLQQAPRGHLSLQASYAAVCTPAKETKDSWVVDLMSPAVTPTNDPDALPSLNQVDINSLEDLHDILQRNHSVFQGALVNRPGSSSSASLASVHTVLTLNLQQHPASTLSMLSGPRPPPQTTTLTFAELLAPDNIQGGLGPGIGALEDVLRALKEGTHHVPWKTSMLTHVLQSGLGAASTVLLVTTVTAGAADANTTLATLRYAARVRDTMAGGHPSRGVAMPPVWLDNPSTTSGPVSATPASLTSSMASSKPQPPASSSLRDRDFEHPRAWQSPSKSRGESPGKFAASPPTLSGPPQRAVESPVRGVSSSWAPGVSSSPVGRSRGGGGGAGELRRSRERLDWESHYQSGSAVEGYGELLAGLRRLEGGSRLEALGEQLLEELGSARSQVSAYKQELQGLKTSTQHLNHSLASTEMTLSSTQDKARSLEEELASERSRLGLEVAEKESALARVARAEAAANSFESSLQAAETNHASLESEIKRLEQRELELKDQLHQQQEGSLKAELQVSDARAQAELQLSDMRAKAELQLSEVRAKAELQLSEVRAQLGSTSDECTSVLRANDELYAELVKLRGDLEQLQEGNQQTKEELQQSQDREAQTQLSLNEARTKIEGLQDEVEWLKESWKKDVEALVAQADGDMEQQRLKHDKEMEDAWISREKELERVRAGLEGELMDERAAREDERDRAHIAAEAAAAEMAAATAEWAATEGSLTSKLEDHGSRIAHLQTQATQEAQVLRELQAELQTKEGLLRDSRRHVEELERNSTKLEDSLQLAQRASTQLEDSLAHAVARADAVHHELVEERAVVGQLRERNRNLEKDLEREHENIHRTNTQLKSSQEKAADEINDLRSRLQNSRQEIESVKQDRNARNDEVSRFRRELSDMEELNKRTAAACKAALKEAEASQQQVEQPRRELAEQKMQNEEITMRMEKTEARMAEKEKEHDERTALLKRNIAALQEVCGAKDQALRHIWNEIGRVPRVEELSASAPKSKRECDMYPDGLDELKVSLEVVNLVNETLRLQAELKRWHKQCQEEEARANTAEAALKEKQEELEAVQMSLREEEALREKEEEKLTSSRQLICSLEEQIQQHLHQIETSRQEIEHLGRVIEGLKQEVTQVSGERDSWKTSSEVEKEKVEHGLRMLEAARQAQEELVVEVERLQRELGDATCRLHESVTKSDDLYAQMQQLHSEAHREHTRAEDVSHSLNVALKDRDEANLQLEETRKKLKDVEESEAMIRRELDLARMENSASAERLQGYDIRVRELEQDNKGAGEVAEEVLARREECAELRARVGAQAEELGVLRAEREEGVTARLQAREAREEANSLHMQLQGLKDALRHSEGQVASLRLEKGSLQALVELAQDDVKRMTLETENVYRDRTQRDIHDLGGSFYSGGGGGGGGGGSPRGDPRTTSVIPRDNASYSDIRSSRSEQSFLNPNTPLSRVGQQGFSFASNSPFTLETPANSQAGNAGGRVQWPWEKELVYPKEEDGQISYTPLYSHTRDGHRS